MTPCPWCGMMSVDDICPWCKRSKNGASWSPDGDDQLHPKDRMREALGIIGSLVVVAALVAVVVFGLMKADNGPTAQGTSPSSTVAQALPTSEVSFPMPSDTTAAEPLATSPRASSAQDRRTRPSGPQPSGVERASGETAKQIGAGSIKISNATLNTVDDGSGMPTEMGSVTLINNCSGEIRRVDVRLQIGERTYRLAPLGDVRIAPGATAPIAVRSYMTVAKHEDLARQIVVQAQVGNPPTVVMDSFTLP